MMKLRQFLKNLARRGLNLIIIFCLISGCSSSTKPTYFKENIEESVRSICQKEYQIDVKVKLVGSTLWVYLPVEDVFIKSDKPEKYPEKFLIEQNNNAFQADSLKLEYLIKAVPEREKQQDYKYNKNVADKVNKVLKVMHRVIFSMEFPKEKGPKFFCLIIADIKNAFETKEIFYSPDLKKAAYEFISWGEYQHRVIQEGNISPAILGDKEGDHVVYKDITLKEFIVKQIDHRIKLKFQRPEVDTNVDIDKEIIKIVALTLTTYDFKDFTAVELNNLLSKNKIILNQAEIWASIVK